MSYRVVSYCPDRHIQYDGRTPYETGIGGGVTARVRMAKALAQLGHRVTMVVNCPREEVIDGVRYIPLNTVRRIEADILIVNTSGGAIDLGPIVEVEVNAALKIVWLHGTIEPRGLDALDYDHTYAVSNFVAETARSEWSVAPKSMFVTYNAFEQQLFSEAETSQSSRDPHRLVYFSHPSKGLDTAVAIVRLLRQFDSRYHLEVFGGHRLWGERERPIVHESGVTYHGLTGQRALFRALLWASFALQMQSREEPFSLAVIEAMRAGCIVLASTVGAFPELIDSGRNGFLLAGDHNQAETRRRAAELILKLAEADSQVKDIRHRAMQAPWDSHRSARVWEQHWDLVLNEGDWRDAADSIPCTRCGSPSVEFLDGVHCASCGFYEPVTNTAQRDPLPQPQR